MCVGVYALACVVGLCLVTPKAAFSVVCSPALLGTSQHTGCPNNQIGHHDIKTFVPAAGLLRGSGPSRRTLVGRTASNKAEDALRTPCSNKTGQITSY